jgi:hypothetical protein
MERPVAVANWKTTRAKPCSIRINSIDSTFARNRGSGNSWRTGFPMITTASSRLGGHARNRRRQCLIRGGTTLSKGSFLFLGSVPAHRRRASGDQNETAARTRRSVQPVCSTSADKITRTVLLPSGAAVRCSALAKSSSVACVALNLPVLNGDCKVKPEIALRLEPNLIRAG